MWPDDSLALHPDKSCMFNFMPDENAVTWFTVHAALAPMNSTLPAGFPGHYFIMNSAPQFQRTPFIAQFDGDAQDVIMLAYKVSDMRVYAYGIPMDKVVTFKPPTAKGRQHQEVDEAAILSSYKLPHKGIVNIKDLTNTETHKLADMVENMLQYIPLFKQARIANLKDFPAVEAATVHANILRACTAAELRLRKVAAARGDTSKDPKESAAGGAEAGKTVATIRSQLLANMGKFYEPDIEDRFFKVQTAAGSMRLTEEGLKDAHEAIKNSHTTLEDQLHKSLDKLGELSKEADVAAKLNFAVQSPIESLLVAAVSKRAMLKIPFMELDGGGGGGGRDGGRDGGGSGEGDGKGGDDGEGGGDGEGKGDGDGRGRGRGGGGRGGGRGERKRGRPRKTEEPEAKAQKAAEAGNNRMSAAQMAAIISQNEALKGQVASLQRDHLALQQKYDDKAREVAMLEAQARMYGELTKEKISAATANAELRSIKFMLDRQGKSDLFGSGSRAGSGSGSKGGSRSGSPWGPMGADTRDGNDDE